MGTYVGDGNPNTITGGSGDDQITGNGGNDKLIGGAGADTLDGGDGEDSLYSGDYSGPFSLPYYSIPYTAPLLDTGTEVDTLTGGAGDDRLFAGYGDNVDGGANAYAGDYLYISFQGAPSGVTVDFRQEIVVVGGGTIVNVENVSWIEGSNFDDDINSGSRSSGYSDFTVVFGLGGNDHLVAGYYTGTLYGGDGDDVVDGRGSQYLMRVDGGAGDDTLYTVPGSHAVASGGAGNDTIYSNGQTSGGEGNDTIVVQYSDFYSSVHGDDGDDVINAANAFSYASTYLYGDGGSDIIHGSDGSDQMDGGNGADTMNGSLGDDSYVVDDWGDVVTEFPNQGVDSVYTALGTAGSSYTIPAYVEKFGAMTGAGQTVIGNALDNVLVMGPGNDVVDLSSGGNDNANGGYGNDYFYFGGAFTAADTVVGGGDTDTVGLLGNYNLTLGADTLSGVETLSLLSGTAAGGTDHVSYSITTVDSNVPAGGRLTVYAGGLLSDETLFFNGYAETNGALSVYGGAGNDTFAGGPANDAFVGGAGDDTMYGLGGMDWLEGGLGADTMRGGLGNDLYVYQSAAESTAAKTDHILDFEYVSDHISLTNIDSNTGVAGDQAFSFIGDTAFSHTAGELRAYQSGASWFVEGDVDGDGSADLVIQVDAVAGHAIVASDFLL